MYNNPAEAQAWMKLQGKAAQMRNQTLSGLFKSDPARAQRYFYKHQGLSADFSKNQIDEEIIGLLLELARAQDVEGWRDRMFSGESVNVTEKRAVLHTALRRPADDSVIIDNENIMPFVHDVLARMKSFTQDVRNGTWRGYTGKPIRNIVNIGIGGSDLGPHMVCEALKAFSDPGLSVHFVSNIDATHLLQTLSVCDPETTLFLVASKTFTTQETMANAHSARSWLLASLKHEDAIARHFAALSTNEAAVQSFGIAPGNMFPFRDWVGGRYSLWSAIGLSICLAIGFERFEELLAGGHEMDIHFRTAPLEKNIPVLMGLIGIWHRNFMQYPAYAVLPYDQNLRLFPAFLQQLDMESNGKSVDRNGDVISGYQTGPVLFGVPGTDGQHSFYQLIHQGTDIVPCEFIAARSSNYPLGNHHAVLLTHMLAQAQALLQGRDLIQAKGNINRVFSGNRPSSALIVDRLDPYHLGMLIALYEHRIFVQGIIWNINSFDQFGVELGKELAKAIESGDNGGLDASTASLKEYLGL